MIFEKKSFLAPKNLENYLIHGIDKRRLMVVFM